MSAHLDFYTAYDWFENDNHEERVRHLMRLYSWSKDEAECYYFYEPYDENDWIDYE